MVRRQSLGRHQVWFYLAAICVGLLVGGAAPQLGGVLEALVWPLLALLLFTTFLQVPLGQLQTVLQDRRFFTAILLGNFLLMPLVLWGVLAVTPLDPATRLGVIMVLLVPCTDWFVTFTHLGRGDGRRAVAATPALLVIQFLLLPIYLRVFMGEGFVGTVPWSNALIAFGTLIVLPALAARALQRRAERSPSARDAIERLAWAPIPLLALVLGAIAASQVQLVRESLALLVPLSGAYLAYLIGALIVGLLLGRAFCLNVGSARTLVFSLATRNSFVVLPLALALPPAWHAAVVAIAFQSLVELLGMVALVRLVPRLVAGRRSSARGDQRDAG